jgi:hypothetical protein
MPVCVHCGRPLKTTQGLASHIRARHAAQAWAKPPKKTPTKK